MPPTLRFRASPAHGTALALGLACLTAAAAAAPPWWDDFPTIIQSGEAKEAISAHATASLCAGANDPVWGIFAQRQSIVSSRRTVAGLHAAGIQAMTWFEGFGTCGSYIVELRRKPAGAWETIEGEPDLARVFHSHWDWQLFDGAGEIGWTGPHGYFTDEPFARPWTRTHPRYGCPPMTYPDGRVATGYRGPADDPRNSLVLDAGCSKDVLGRVSFEYDYNATLNQIAADTRKPHGPLAGLLRVADAPLGPPDPGFTPEQWRQVKKAGYAGDVDAGKDSACPIWIDYVRASVRQALDAGIDGLWVDNYSPWDSFGGNPVLKAFGDWSVVGFREHLRSGFTPAQLGTMGVADAASFDVRRYLQTRCRVWGGRPENLDDPIWRDPRWREDAVWRAYLIYKRVQGTRALTAFYRTVKAEAAAAGKPDFLVSGNDIPLYSLGWARGDLDMVSTELSWGWHLTSGPRGLMPPPRGNYAPVYKLAREHARSRFVNAWMYVPGPQLGATNIARVLYYQGLANHALPVPNPGGRTAGNPATDTAFFEFVRQAAPIFGARVPVEEIGLYHSSSTQLLEMMPGGFRDHARQPHSFAFWGWGTALTELHLPWRAVPEWKLLDALHDGLRALIVPEAGVFAPGDARAVREWVLSGGILLFTGESGIRAGEEGNFAPLAPSETLSSLLGGTGGNAAPDATGARSFPLGKGRVIQLASDPGLAYYLADQERARLREPFRPLLASLAGVGGHFALEAPGVPATVGLTLYQREGACFIDVNNTAIDLDRDTITPTAPLHFTVALPAGLRNRTLRARVLSPDGTLTAVISSLPGERVEVTLPPVVVYASLLIEPEEKPASR